MSEMFQRVMRALTVTILRERTERNGKCSMNVLTRAVFDAMYEPTEEMADAPDHHWLADSDFQTYRELATEVWQSMIDAARKEDGPGLDRPELDATWERMIAARKEEE